MKYSVGGGRIAEGEETIYPYFSGWPKGPSDLPDQPLASLVFSLCILEFGEGPSVGSEHLWWRRSID